MAPAVKFAKWNGFVRMDLPQLIEFLNSNGVEMQVDRTAITGVVYEPETQVVKIHVTSMLTPKEEKEFAKYYPYLYENDEPKKNKQEAE